jgi:aldehyde dehydrogenase (NAD+)
MNLNEVLSSLKISDKNTGTYTGQLNHGHKLTVISSCSPVDGKAIAEVSVTDNQAYEMVMAYAQSAYVQWREWPAPKRGEVVRQIGDALRINKEALGTLVSYEMGKSLQEGLGEVQEMIDICDFAVGLSRQLYGMTMQSERVGHRLYEQWHPLGVVGIISAFNFPVAVWSWNAMIALICGNVCIWKPSEKTPITAIACQHIIKDVLEKNNVPEGVLNLIIGGKECGEMLTQDRRVALISATGSTEMGRAVGQEVAARFGKSILELGGNNAIIVTADADLSIAITAAVFGAIGTAGQRCTSTRRLIVHKDIYDEFKHKLIHAYNQVRIGNPLDAHNHVGPIIDKSAVELYLDTIDTIKEQGGVFIVEGGLLTGDGYESGCYVKPCIAAVESTTPIIQKETFAPILYLMKYEELTEAIAIQNSVPQGLSSAIMTTDLRKAEQFLSNKGSDCGIANVNIGTSGAEIGGAFGGEKETGGGRESGSDAWKSYMRRQTVTINYSSSLPLAQGISFEL